MTLLNLKKSIFKTTILFQLNSHVSGFTLLIKPDQTKALFLKRIKISANYKYDSFLLFF